jgi:hypothetical protein
VIEIHEILEINEYIHKIGARTVQRRRDLFGFIKLLHCVTAVRFKYNGFWYIQYIGTETRRNLLDGKLFNRGSHAARTPQYGFTHLTVSDGLDNVIGPLFGYEHIHPPYIQLRKFESRGRG